MKDNFKEYLTIPEVARILGLSRIAVFKKVKKGEIKAIKVGRNYAISKACMDSILGRMLSEDDKREIDRAVKKTIHDYGETLKLLGKE